MLAGRAVAVVGDVVKLREKLSWWESKPLFGWKVLVPRTKEQAAALSDQLTSYGAIPVEVPTIAVEPPRTPQAVDRAIRGLVSGRYAWLALTSVNAAKAIREKIEELGLDARALAGVKVACVGEQTAAAMVAWGVRPDLVPSAEQSSEGLLADWPPYEPGYDALDRVLLPRADIATETLSAGLARARLAGRRRHGVPDRARRAAARRDPRGDQDRRVRRGAVHVVLHGAQPRRDRRQAAHVEHHRGDRAADREDRRGARAAGRCAWPRRHRSRRWPRGWPSSAGRVARPASCCRPARPTGPRRWHGPRSRDDAPAGGFPRRGRDGCAGRRRCAGLPSQVVGRRRPTWCCRCSSRRRSVEPVPIPSMPGVVQHSA